MRTRWVNRLCAAAIALSTAAPALAQQTRDEERAAAQADKAGQLHPYVATSGERWVEKVEKWTLGAPTTFYPFIGSVYPGGAMALGPGYRARYGDSGVFAAHAAWSIKNYRGADAVLTLPEIAEGFTTSLSASWMLAPSVKFFGLGPDSPAEDRGSYRYQNATAGAAVRYALVRDVAIGGAVDYIDAETQGVSTARFTPDVVRGLGTDVTYVRTSARAEVDWRESPGYSTSGGLYRLDWSSYLAQRNAPHSFTRLDAEATQLIPILRANWVIALRAMASVTNAAEGETVPAFLLPSLGGGESLRGYPPWRFRDRHRLLFTGEYRWTAGQFVDMALFLDAGKVASRKEDLDLTDLNRSFGIGVRFHAPGATFLRVELARTRDDGYGIIFSVGPPF